MCWMPHRPQTCCLRPTQLPRLFDVRPPNSGKIRPELKPLLDHLARLTFEDLMHQAVEPKGEQPTPTPRDERAPRSMSIVNP